MITSERCGDITSQIEDEQFVWVLPTDMIPTNNSPILTIDSELMKERYEELIEQLNKCELLILKPEKIALVKYQENPMWIIDMTPIHVINIKDDMTIPNPMFNIGLPDEAFTVTCTQPIAVEE